MSAAHGDSDPVVQWTIDSNNDTNPAWSPEGRSIAFVSDRSGKQQVYVLNQPESTTVPPTLISDGTANDTDPTWEPLLVVMDPGHGHILLSGQVTCQGASAAGVCEDDLVLDIACNAKSAERLRTLITRDPAPSCAQQVWSIGKTKVAQLDKRVRLANQKKVALFVSFHLNASKVVSDTTSNGAAVFYYGQGPIGRRLESSDLAQEVLNKVAALGLNVDVNGGVQQANFEVLKYTKMPAILIESGFLTNSTLAAGQTVTDQQRLLDPLFRAILGRAIAAGIASHLAK